MTKHVTDATFNDTIRDGITFVDFWAEWCGPCRMLEPVIEELAEQFKGKIKIVKLNVDENKETAQRYGIMSIPTMIYFQDGKAIEKVTGYHPKEKLAEYLQSKL